MDIIGFTAIAGKACFHCLKSIKPLKICSGCSTVRYCNRSCQLANWSKHKDICRALRRLETDEEIRMKISYICSLVTPVEDPAFLVNTLYCINMIQVAYIKKFLKRELTMQENNLLIYEPCCMGCGRSNRIIRMSAAAESEANQAVVSNTLKSCRACKSTFYCSEDHWNVVRHRHFGEPSEGGHDNLTHCRISQEIRRTVEYQAGLPFRDDLGGFRWLSETHLCSWRSLKNTDWKEQYCSRPSRGPPGVPLEDMSLVLRSASEGLSMPLTILWALENLNDGLEWTLADTLTIHILESHDFQIEILKGHALEELLHRLPDVRKLRVVYCGARLNEIFSPEGEHTEDNLSSCINCQQHGQIRTFQLVFQAYHEFVTSGMYTKPDLAVAFNSGASQDDVDSWKLTMTCLVKNKIPTVFTAHNREEATEEAELLALAGANLVPALGPARNPWGSLLVKPEPFNLTSFYATSGWLSGGFRD